MKSYSSVLEPRITVSSLNMLEPVNGHNKRLFYCQNHEVHKQNFYVFFLLAPERFFPETFNHKTNLRGASRSDTICKKQLRCELIFVLTLSELLEGGNQAVWGDQVKDL